MTLSQELVSFGLSRPELPDDVRHAVRRHLLDGLGNAIASARVDVVRPAVEVSLGLGGPDEATVIGSGRRVGAPAAALANGALIHGFDFDDTHADALVHATSVVLPTAFAVGQQVGAEDDEVLRAAVAGYELTLRLGAAVPHGFHARGFHATSVVGVFGAAMVAARLLGLSGDEAVHALGIAGSQAAGSLEFLGSGASTKQLHPGFAAMNGILAARLAAAGATGPATIFEGDAGLFRTHADQAVDPDRVTDGLGERYELQRITIKPYPVCQLSHAALDAIATVRDRLTDPSVIVAIEVDLPAESVPIVAEPTAGKRRPATAYDARFSLPFSLAALVIDGGIGIDAFGPDHLARRDLLALADRVQVRPVTFEMAAAAAPGRVRVRLDDGSEVTGDVPVSRGGPDRPLTDAALVEKFRTNAAGADVDALVQALLGLGGGTHLDEILRLADAAVRTPTGSTTAQ